MGKLTEAIYFVEEFVEGLFKVKKLSAIYQVVSQVILQAEMDTKDVRKFVEEDMKHAVIKKIMKDVLEHISEKTELESFMGMKVFVTSVIGERDKIMVVHPEEYAKMLRRHYGEGE